MREPDGTAPAGTRVVTQAAPLVCALALAALLGGCGSDATAQGRAEDPSGVCDAAVNEDQTVRDMRARSAGTDSYALLHHDDLNDAIRDARTRCLRARGLIPPGGVERPRRERNLFDGLF